MISAVLLFFGATLLYTGFLVSARDLTSGLAVAFMGLILLIKPALLGLNYYRFHFGGRPAFGASEKGQKKDRKVVHLKIVKSGDDKPTIH